MRREGLSAGDCVVAAECPVADACCARTRAPCESVEQAHAEKLRMCDELELIADQLPGSVDRLLCLQVANALVPLLRGSHRYEEELIFPAYAKAVGATGALPPSLSRLCAEHVEDECFAAEVTEALLVMGHGGRIDNPEATGFMLRGFFESLRRHVAFEREHVLPTILTVGSPHAEPDS